MKKSEIKRKFCLILLILCYYPDELITFLSKYYYILNGKKAIRCNYLRHILWKISPLIKKIDMEDYE